MLSEFSVLSLSDLHFSAIPIQTLTIPLLTPNGYQKSSLIPYGELRMAPQRPNRSLLLPLMVFRVNL